MDFDAMTKTPTNRQLSDELLAKLAEEALPASNIFMLLARLNLASKKGDEEFPDGVDDPYTLASSLVVQLAQWLATRNLEVAKKTGYSHSRSSKPPHCYELDERNALVALCALTGNLKLSKIPEAANDVAKAMKDIRDANGELSINEALKTHGRYSRDWQDNCGTARFILVAEEASNLLEGFDMIETLDALIETTQSRKGGRPRKTSTQ